MYRGPDNPLHIFIEGWGRMGTHWGIGKVMAQIHALLFLSTRPMSLEDMSEHLKTSRSNISLNVRALQDLGVVKKVIIPGDRRDYYSAEESIEKVTRGLAAAKKKRKLAVYFCRNTHLKKRAAPAGGSSFLSSRASYGQLTPSRRLPSESNPSGPSAPTRQLLRARTR